MLCAHDNLHDTSCNCNNNGEERRWSKSTTTSKTGRIAIHHLLLHPSDASRPLPPARAPKKIGRHLFRLPDKDAVAVLAGVDLIVVNLLLVLKCWVVAAPVGTF